MKQKTCHKCSTMYIGWRCPRCRKARKGHKSSGGSRSSGRRFGMAGSSLSASLISAAVLSATPAPAPIWAADPVKFWRDVVESVCLAHNASGQQFVTARWYGGAGGNERAHTFLLDDVRELVTRYYVLPDGTSKQNQTGVKA